VPKERLPKERLHVYSGHAGWAPGQLENEVERGDWFVWTADSDTVFSDESGEKVWSRLLSHTASVLAQKGIAGSRVLDAAP
jgi:putative transcriptional regulator